MRAAAAALAALAGLASPAAADDALGEARRAVEAGDLERAETVLRGRTSERPDDDEARRQLARVLTWRGRTDESLREFDALLARAPGDPDLLVGRAFALWFAGRTAESREALDAALARAPRYDDAHRLRLRVLDRLGDGAALERARAAAAAAYPERDPSWWEEAPPAGEDGAPRAAATELEAGFTAHDTGPGRRDWTSEWVQVVLRRRPAPDEPGTPRAGMSLRAEDLRRFGERDTLLRAEAWTAAGSGWDVRAALQASPEHRFSPVWRAEAGAGRALGGGWVAGASVRRSEYDRAVVDSASATAELYAGDWRAEWTVTGDRVRGAGSGVSHRLALDRYHGDGRSRIGAFVASGREVEDLGGGVVRRGDAWSAGLSGRHAIAAGWAVVWGISTERGDAFGRRRGVLLGVQRDL